MAVAILGQYLSTRYGFQASGISVCMPRTIRTMSDRPAARRFMQAMRLRAGTEVTKSWLRSVRKGKTRIPAGIRPASTFA